MTVYFFVALFTIVLFGYAEYLDNHEINTVNGHIYHSKNSKVLFIAGALVLIFVAGLRYYVGTDYSGYYVGYPQYVSTLWKALLHFNEPGTRLLFAICSLFSSDPAVGLFCAAAVTLGISFVTLYKNSTHLFEAGLLFVFMGGWHGCFNGVRQYLAMAFVFFAYPYMRDRKFWKFLLLIFIAFLFHKSAIIMIIPYFFVNWKISYKNEIVLILACVAFFLLYDRVFGLVNFLLDEDIRWDMDYMKNSVNPLRTLVQVVPAVYYLVTYWNADKDMEETAALNLLIVNAVAMILASGSAYLARIGIYTSPFTAIAMPKLNERLTGKNRRFTMAVILILYGIYWWYEISHSGSLNTFRWIWER